MTDDAEVQAVAKRYARRDPGHRYSLLHADVWQTVQERQRAMLGLFARLGLTDLGTLKALEVGCGAGGNLLELLRIGFEPQNLRGVELLPERYRRARAVLPETLNLREGDALQMEVPLQSQDIVLAFTVFSSLLDAAFQERLANAMWSWVKPGGGVLWYDFTLGNPRNLDVRGVPLWRLQQLFPQAAIHSQRLTLAPPLARAVTRIHPALYTLFNTLPLLRTHVLAWVGKYRVV